MFGRGREIWGMRQRRRCPFLAASPSHGQGWLWAGCGGMLGRVERLRLLSLLLKGTQQEERERGNLYRAAPAPKGLGAHFGLAPARKPRALQGQLLLPSCLSRAAGFLPVGRELGACLSPLAAGESPAPRCIRQPGPDTSGEAPRATAVPSVP